MSNTQDESSAYAMLKDVLSKAVASNADAVEMERDSGGSLEVCFMSGNSGAGFMLNREAGWALIEALWQEKKKARGKAFRITLEGKDYMVSVKTYDHFGENAYRLTIRKAKG